MLDYEFIKNCNIDSSKVDIDKSHLSFQPNTNYITIELYLKKESNIICPFCGSNNSKIRGSRCNKMKSTIINSQNAIINVHRRVYKCSCGKTFTEDNPVRHDGKTITLQKEISILNALRDSSKTFTSVAKEFDVSTTYVINLFDVKVDLKRLKLPKVLCIDEVYAKYLVDHSYCCVLYAPQWKMIVDILPSRWKTNLIDYFSRIPLEEKKNVEFVSMDLWEPYRDTIKLCFPWVKICADPYHVTKYLVLGFNNFRIRIMRKYESKKEDNTGYYWLYKKYWKFLIIDFSKITDKPIRVSKSGMTLTKYQIREYMLSIDPKLALAYELKEAYLSFNAKATIENAEELLNSLISEFKEAHIPEYADFIRIMGKWRNEIINSFNRINGHKITNGPMERVNRDIKSIFRNSFGSKNFTRMRNRVIFCINETAPILAWKKPKSNKTLKGPRGPYKKKEK